MERQARAFLAAMAAGDTDALGGLFDLLSARVFHYARAITRSREIAEDITHDVFLRVWHQAARLAEMANPVAYIMVATRNRAYDDLRRAARVTAGAGEERAADGAPYGRMLIEEAFSGLPANQRETIYLHFICGFTQREVAGMMDVPLVTVKWRCKKARSQLRAYFGEGEGGSHEIL